MIHQISLISFLHIETTDKAEYFHTLKIVNWNYKKLIIVKNKVS